MMLSLPVGPLPSKGETAIRVVRASRQTNRDLFSVALLSLAMCCDVSARASGTYAEFVGDTLKLFIGISVMALVLPCRD
jgi:hypothetical protein